MLEKINQKQNVRIKTAPKNEAKFKGLERIGRLLTVRGIGERERLVRSLGFILARIKMDKAFLFIFLHIYFRTYLLKECVFGYQNQ